MWCKLCDIIQLISGQDFPPEKYNDNCKGIPYITGASNIKEDKLLISRWTTYPSVFSYMHDLLIVCKGAGVGKLAINDSGDVHIARQIQAIRDYSKLLNIHFVKTVIQYNLSNIISCANGLIPGLKRDSLLCLNFPLPPKSEQDRIVCEIERFITIIENIDQSQAELNKSVKLIKNKILDLAIHGKLVPQNPNDEPAFELLKRINSKSEIASDNGHYPQLPNSWCVLPMQMICSLCDGEKQSGTDRLNLDVKYLRGERDGKILNEGRFIPADSFLILVDGENSGEVFRTPIEGYQGSTFKQLAINTNMNTDYVLQVINYHRKTLRENKVGSAIPHLNKKLFKAIEVPIPPYKEQQRIINTISMTFKYLDTIMESL